MAPGIIKQGSARASAIQPFTFSDNAAESVSTGQAFSWMEVSAHTEAAPANELPISAEFPEAAPDLAQLEKAAYESGYLEGQKEGKAIAEQAIELARKRLADAILDLSTLKSTLCSQVEREVVRLAMEVARKIVCREIRVDPDIIQTLVRVALSHVTEKSSVTIHLSPGDYGYLQKQRAEMSQTEGREITLVADNSIEPGGCLIQTACGDIDARIDQKFLEVEQAFFEGLK